MKGVYFMRKNSIFFRFCIVFLIFFLGNRSVYAATKLTCMYEKGHNWNGAIKKVVLHQNENGEIIIYKNSEDADLDGNVSNSKKKSYWKISTDPHYLHPGPNPKPSVDSDGFLTECPGGKETSDDGEGGIIFYGGTYGNQKLLSDVNLVGKDARLPATSASSTSGSHDSIPELTCVYEKGKFEKVAFTQSSSGVITIYKNTDDVWIDDKTYYWDKVQVSTDWSKTSAADTGYLKKCPASKTTASHIGADGQLTFYDDNSGENKLLEPSYNEVKTIQVGQDSYVPNKTYFDSEKYKDTKCEDIPIEDMWLHNLDGYTQRCLYAKNISTLNKCHIVQVNLGTKGVKAFTSDANFPFKGNTFKYSFINQGDAETINSGVCPTSLMVDRKVYSAYGNDDGVTVVTDVSFSGSKGEPYSLVKDGVEGKNWLTGAEATYDFSFKIKFQKIKIESCDDLFKENEELLNALKAIVSVVKIIVPIILLVLGSLDFAQAILSSNDDGIKKAQSKFIRRLILGVVIFLIPSMLKAILTIANTVWPIIDADLCGII